MKKETLGLTALVQHAFPAALASSPQGKRLRSTATILEAAIVTSTHNKLLLLVEETLVQELVMIALERFLRYTQCQRLLLLMSQESKGMTTETWEQATSWEDGQALKDRFVMTRHPQQAQQAQVCLVTILEIQKELGMQTHPFLDSFDIVILYNVTAHPGPAWSQMVDQCAASGACVIGLSSTLSPENGRFFFERVIDARMAPSVKVKRL